MFTRLKKSFKSKTYETSKFIEHKLMKEHVGSQDQFWATYEVLDLLILIKTKH